MTIEKMQAARAHDYGEPEVLVVESALRPTAEAGQVVVKLHAAGVNPADWKYRSGMYKQYVPLTFPWTPGLDGAGVITAIGPDVTTFAVGQRVFGTINASYAEYAATPISEIVALPDALSFEEGAAIPVGALTAWQAVELAEIKPGQRVLVQGAAGGVGLFAVQLARRHGAHVIGTASTANLDFVRGLGADEVVDYTAQPVAQVVKDVDVVIDTVGGAVAEASWELVKRGGLLLTVAGRLSPEKAEALGVRAISGNRAPSQHLTEIGALAASKQLQVLVSQTFPLAQAAEAQRLSQTGHGRGRIVLHIAD